MCNKTACTSVGNMCVSEGVSVSERLCGNIHVCTSMLAAWRMSYLHLLRRRDIFTETTFSPRVFLSLSVHCMCTDI